jgi:hypothetical protein
MMNKILWGIMALMWVVWSADYFYFRHQGARFTAAHGQALCLRVQALEPSPAPCHYAP